MAQLDDVHSVLRLNYEDSERSDFIGPADRRKTYPIWNTGRYTTKQRLVVESPVMRENRR